MAIDRLIGSDAELQKVAFGTPLVTGTAVDSSWYKIVKSEGDGSVFPVGFTVGMLIQGSMVVAAFDADNTASLATFTTVLDASSFTVELSKDEVEVTVLADTVKKYRAGKSDFSGTIEGITFISEARKVGSIMNRFFATVDGLNSQGTGTGVLSAIDNSDYYIRGLLQADDTVGETLTFLVAQVELFGFSVGAAQGDVQSWSSGMRVIGAEPLVYFMDNTAST